MLIVEIVKIWQKQGNIKVGGESHAVYQSVYVADYGDSFSCGGGSFHLES